MSTLVACMLHVPIGVLVLLQLFELI